MKLIEFDGLDFKLADEAFLVRPIRKLYEEDKTKKKDYFWKELSYIFFMCDPRSNYMYITDEADRSKEIVIQEGLGADWEPSELLKEAMAVYKNLSTTTASLLIEDMRYGLNCIRAMIRTIGKSVQPSKDDSDEDRSVMAMKLDKALDTMTKAVDKIPDLAKKLVEAEKSLAKDFAADDKARGNAEKAVGEDV